MSNPAELLTLFLSCNMAATPGQMLVAEVGYSITHNLRRGKFR